ncbi:MAG: hypothetical protein IT428_32165 [Planctomycetaceae bacterium]|nr:hypothetical protein [Planctomycetaceae bacterium]
MTMPPARPVMAARRPIAPPVSAAASIVSAPLGMAGGVACTLWSGYLLLSPFYFFESGQPQIADYILALLTGWLALARGFSFSRALTGIVVTAALLTSYIVLVNGSWTVLLGEDELLLYTAFYLFNFVALLDTAILCHWLGRRFGELTGVTSVMSLMLQFGLSFVVDGGGAERGAMFFNNPNQLGYYAVLFASLVWAWSQWSSRSKNTLVMVEIAAYIAAGWLTIVSQSRGAISAFAILVFLRAAARVNVVLLGAAALIGVALMQSDLPLIESMRSRMEHKSQGTNEEMSYRGYDRMFNHPNYLWLGAGEGCYWRFRSDHPGEMHSNFGSLLFCYGAVGLGVFLRLFWVTFRDAGVKATLYLMPAMAYGLSHNGLRQSELWILFALAVGLHSTRLAARPLARIAAMPPASRPGVRPKAPRRSAASRPLNEIPAARQTGPRRR